MRAGLAFLALAVAWTWPAVVTPGLYGQQPDAAGTAWFIDAAPRLSTSLRDAQTGWPAGVAYGRPDSFVLLALGSVLGWAEPARVHALVGVLGLALSAWAAEWFARAAGARAPWSLLAGVGFAFGGLASTALLEGYVYHLFDPWLPLLGWAWLRATSPSGTLLHGLAAGVAFVLTVLTTAWLGLAAVLLLVGIALGGRLALRPLAGAAAVAVPAMAIYVAAFLAAGDNADQNLSLASTPIQQLTLSLVRFSGPTVSTDVMGHHQTANIPGVVLALFAAAPVVLRRVRGWRSLFATGALALALSLAPRVDPAVWASLVPEAAARFASLVGESVLRFPERIGWATALCAGVVAARVATELHRRAGWLAYGVVPLALVDVFGVQDLDDRQRMAPIAVPSAYAGTGAVLDLWPEDVSPAPAWTLLTTNTGCYYQAGHGRPIADHCIFVGGEASPRLRVGAWLVDRLLVGDTASAAETLGRLGFTTVAVHVDYFRSEDRNRLLAGLAAIDAAPARSTDGGEAIVAFAIPPVPGADPAAEWAKWSS